MAWKDRIVTPDDIKEETDPEQKSDKFDRWLNLLWKITIGKLILIFTMAIIVTVLVIIVSHINNTVDHNTENVNKLTAQVEHLTTLAQDAADSARKTEKALKAALKQAEDTNQGQLIVDIRQGLEAIKRIEAKLDAGG